VACAVEIACATSGIEERIRYTKGTRARLKTAVTERTRLWNKQAVSTVLPESGEMRKLSRESYILIGLCIADLISTLWLLAGGDAVEGNPIMNAVLSAGVAPFVMAKFAFVAVPLAIFEWARRRRPEFVLAMLRVTIVLYVSVYGAGVWRLNRSSPEERAQSAALEATAAWAAAIPTPEELGEARLRRLSRTAQLP
jgi:hypothetical protein